MLTVLVLYALPSAYVVWLGWRYFELRVARMLLALVISAFAVTFILEAVSELSRDAGVWLAGTRIWVNVLMIMALPLMILGLALPMAINAFRVKSGVMRGAAEVVASLLMCASIFVTPWMFSLSCSIASVAIVAILHIRGMNSTRL